MAKQTNSSPYWSRLKRKIRADMKSNQQWLKEHDSSLFDTTYTNVVASLAQSALILMWMEEIEGNDGKIP